MFYKEKERHRPGRQVAEDGKDRGIREDIKWGKYDNKRVFI